MALGYPPYATPTARTRTAPPIPYLSHGTLSAGPAQPKAPAAPKVPPVAPAAPAAAAASPAAGVSPYDYSTDPILQSIKAAGQASNQDAQTSADTQTKKELIGYGYDPALAALYPDQGTAGAAQQNPFSVLAQLAHDYTQTQQATNEDLNRQNLFYSGARTKALGELARTNLLNQYNASSAVQGKLGDIQQQLLSARETERQGEITAQQAAAQRAIDFATKYGIDLGSGQPGLPSASSAALTPTSGTAPGGGVDLAKLTALWKQLGSPKGGK